MSLIDTLVRPEILALKPYCSARNEYEGNGNIALDANENPNKPYGSCTLQVNRYPEPQPRALRQVLADLYGVPTNQVLMTRGMDEAIDLLVRIFCIPYQDSITIVTPTFGYYEVSARIQGASIVKVDKIDAIQAETKIIFICTPNNPTGDVVPLSRIRALCEQYAGRAIIAVDEAYIEFSDAPSATTLLQACENLVVMRTLSKAYGMAGVRLGTLMASPAIVDVLKKVLPPYPIPIPCTVRALEGLSPLGLYDAKMKIAAIKSERARLYVALQQSPDIDRVFESDGNFLLFIARDADTLYARLKSQGIVIRKRTHDMPNALRVTIGTVLENDLLLAALGVGQEKISSIRSACEIRKTKETDIRCEVILDEQGKPTIDTGIPFFDHMLEQLSKHSGITMNIKAIGDIQVDVHHTVEDVGITLGMALRNALGDKRGIARYGFVLPMDEAQAQVSMDLSGRGHCECDAVFPASQVGEFPTEMVPHFFESLSSQLGCALHIKVSGKNTHHMVESMFKCVAKTLKQAVSIEHDDLPSTKGVL